MAEKSNLPFDKNNYKIMLLGIAFIGIGFIIMSIDQQEYGFGFLGITLGPIVVLLGFVIEFFAIFHNSKK